MNKSQYKRFTERRAGRSPVLRDTVAAFLSGGSICLFGEGLRQLYLLLGCSEENAPLLTTVSMIFLAVLATGLGVFDTVARVAGAGTLVPVTGFANAVASPALDLTAEGIVLGVGAGIFKVAGPVLLFAVLSGTAYGILYFFFGVVL